LQVVHQRTDEPVVATTAKHAQRQLVSRVISAVLLVPLLPAIGLIIVLVRLTSKSSAIKRERRVGIQGREFTLMTCHIRLQDADINAKSSTSFELPPKMTRVGTFLHDWRLDVLPQLFNVLRGDMCLVGPRPERPDVVADLMDQIPGYEKRFEVAPGLVGLAQLHSTDGQDLDSAMMHHSLDLAYIDSVDSSRHLDPHILCGTALVWLGQSRDEAIRRSGLDAIVPLAIVDTTPDETLLEAA